MNCVTAVESGNVAWLAIRATTPAIASATDHSHASVTMKRFMPENAPGSFAKELFSLEFASKTVRPIRTYDTDKVGLTSKPTYDFIEFAFENDDSALL